MTGMQEASWVNVGSVIEYVDYDGKLTVTVKSPSKDRTGYYRIVAKDEWGSTVERTVHPRTIVIIHAN